MELGKLWKSNFLSFFYNTYIPVLWKRSNFSSGREQSSQPIERDILNVVDKWSENREMEVADGMRVDPGCLALVVPLPTLL